MSLKPLQDRVVIKRVASDEKTPGGIIIPENAKEKPIEGNVVAVGPGRVLDNGRFHELPIKTGQRVLFNKYAGTEIKINGEDHLVVREEDILGIVEDD